MINNSFSFHSNESNINFNNDLLDLSKTNENEFNFNYDLFDLSILNNKEGLSKEENESIYIENYLSFNEEIKNNYININNNFINKNSDISTFLFQKKSLDNDFNFIENNENLSGFENGEFNLNSIKTLKDFPLFSTKKVKQHSKNSEDNKIIKIRTFLGNNIHRFLNGLLEKDKLKLLKLEPKLFHESLKKEYILNIWKNTLKDIYINTKISSKYQKISIYENDINIKTINKIYNENKNKEIIQILNLTYEEIFEIFIRDIKPMSIELTNKLLDSEILNISKFQRTTEFFEEIKAKEKNNKEFE